MAEPSSKNCALTAKVVAAYVNHNPLRSEDLSFMIAAVFDAFECLDHTLSVEAASDPVLRTMSIKASITPDYLVSMEDGRHYKSLKRHLSIRGLSPMQYRVKWQLPHDYPMVAPSYSERRSAIAKAVGLGRR